MGVIAACRPRPDVLLGDLDDAIFAADFGDLINGTAPAVYGQAEVFFRNTHPAAQLKKVVASVFGRLVDPGQPGAFLRLSTGFGGGKTHALMVLWHLAQNVSDPNLGAALLPPTARPSNVSIAAIDAGKAGVPLFAIHGTTKVHSLWGELAWQFQGAAGVASLGDADHPEGQPTESQVEALLPDGPVLILLDELVIYMATLGDRGQGNLISFLNKLAAICGRRPQTVLVVTDPADQRAYSAEAAKLGEELTPAAVRLDDMIGRKASDLDPIGNETAKVIVTRLFESIDRSAAKAAADAYHQLYERLEKDSPGTIPTSAASTGYSERITECYPFHPRLLDTATDRLGALQEYNKSRGTLRLFARIVRSIWERADVTLISAGEIDWTDDRIQADLLQRLNRDQFMAAVGADIEGHAAELDVEYATDAHRRTASALLLESIPNTESSGLTPQDLTLAILRPSEAGPEPAEALERLMGVCWHTYPLAGGVGAQFRYEPNVIRQVEQRMASVPVEDAKARVRSSVQGFYQGPVFELVSWPTEPNQVADGSRLKLVLTETDAIARDVVAHEAPGQPRRFRNAIVAVAPTTSHFDAAVGRAQRLIAAEAIQKEHSGNSSQAKLVKDQLQPILPAFNRQFRLQAFRAFDRVFLADGAALTLDERYLADDEAILAGPKGQDAVRRLLDDQSRLYKPTDSLDPGLLMQHLTGATPIASKTDVFSVKAIHERLLSAPGLRLLPDASVVRNTLQKAVKSGDIVLKVEDGTAYDADGRVVGSPGARKRTSGSPDVFPLDVSTLVTPATSSEAHAWTAVSEPPSGTSAIVDGGGGGADLPPPVVSAPFAEDWSKAVEMAESHSLMRVELVANTAADAKALPSIAAVLSPDETSLDVVVNGILKSGGTGSLNLKNVKLNHPLKPIDLGVTFVNAAENPSFQVVAKLDFGGGASGSRRWAS